jgi:signal transduction histidine kinase
MASVRIHTKFLALILGILVLFLGLLSWVIVRREARLLERKNAEQEHLLTRVVAENLADNMLAGRPRSTLIMIENLRGIYGLAQLEVLRRDGNRAFGAPGPRVDLPQVAQAFEQGREIDVHQQGDPLHHINLFPLRNEAPCRGCHPSAGEVLGVILVSHALGESAAEMRASARQLGILLTAAIVAVGLVVYLTVRRVVLAPLEVLHEGARKLAGGDLGHRIALAGRDEFQDLAGTFNEMAGKLKESLAGLENIVKVRTAELNESVRLMRGILSSMSSGVVLLSRDGTVKLINRQGGWILGHGHDDLLGKKLVEVVPATAPFLSVRVGTYDEVTVPGPEGMQVPVGFTTSYYSGADSEQEGLIVVFQDLSELRILQSELMNKERFAAVGRVVAGVAHEIRNPLFGISAIGQLFERDLKDPTQKELSRALLAEARRLNQLVEDLLIYGRPMKLRLEQADLRVLWEEVLDLHRGELAQRGIRLTGDYAVRHPVTTFDPHQVRQVFLNILRNALEATPDGGHISITMLLEDQSILFRVADNGAGIPTGQLDQVFDLFFTTKPKGTGLGLAICRKIMQDHGGDISVASEEGSGTTVTIRLPYRRGGTAPA